MGDAAIRVDGLGKRYTIAHAGRPRYDTLRDALAGLWRRPFARRDPDQRATSETFWALKDVSFEVQRGEAIGIIGRNGAGKSTLLKILSRIVKPTTGRAEIRGRVGSLLEVGTGFHPELTGRENIFLNGAILGMTRSEIRGRFDEIVAFSGVERFLDTPVKRYSSGMYMRLAFAVAAHLEPEVLIVDEVLAVGDAAFQRKCLGKMSDINQSGRTVLFVSHNLLAVKRLCDHVVVLDRGGVHYAGVTKPGIELYLRLISQNGTVTMVRPGEYDLVGAPRGGQRAQAKGAPLTRFQILDQHDQPVAAIQCGGEVRFVLTYKHDRPLRDPSAGVLISNDSSGPLAFVQTRLHHGDIGSLPAEGELRCVVPRLPFAPGVYTLSLGLSAEGQQLDWIEDQVELHIEAGDVFGSGRLPPSTHGPVLIEATWALPQDS